MSEHKFLTRLPSREFLNRMPSRDLLKRLPSKDLLKRLPSRDLLKRLPSKQDLKDLPKKYPAFKKKYIKPIFIEVYKELRYQRLRQVIVAIIIFLLCFIIMIVFCVITLDMFYFTNFAIVTELRGNQTRLTLFKWIQAAKYKDDEVEKSEICYAGSLEDIIFEKEEDNTLFQCLDKLKKRVHVWYIDKPVMYVMATGTVREKHFQNGTYSTDMLVLLQRVCFKKNWIVQKISVLAAKDESFYKWLTLNYMKNNFKQDENGKNIVNSLAIISLSSQHVEVAYETTFDSEIIEIDGSPRGINTRSYLCLGLREIFNIYYTESMYNPLEPFMYCLFKDSPYIQPNSLPICPFWDDPKTIPRKFKIGFNNGALCMTQIRKLLNNRIQKLSIEKDKTYLLTDLFPDLFEFFETNFAIPRSISLLTNATDRICASNHSYMVKTIKKVLVPPSEVCFILCYLCVLLGELRITEEELARFKLRDIMNELKVDWSIGFTMQTKKNFPKFIFIVLNQIFTFFMVTVYIVIQILIIILFLIILWKHFKMYNEKLLIEGEESTDKDEEKTQPSEITDKKENHETSKQ